MNKDILEGKWHQIKGQVKSQWGKLTDDEIDQVNGNFERMSGLLQEKYGKSREAAEREIKTWLDS